MNVWTKKEDEKKIVENTVKYCKKKMFIKSRDNRSVCKCIQAAIILSMVTCPATLDSESENLPALLKADMLKSKYRTQNASNPDHKENGYRNVIRTFFAKTT